MRVQQKSLENDFPLEIVRRKYTQYTQDEFILVCGFKRSTYQSYAAGKTELKFTGEQLINVAKVVGLSLREVLEELGFDVSEAPYDYPPLKLLPETPRLKPGA